jgi:hypothetical protein
MVAVALATRTTTAAQTTPATQTTPAAQITPAARPGGGSRGGGLPASFGTSLPGTDDSRILDETRSGHGT